MEIKYIVEKEYITDGLDFRLHVSEDRISELEYTSEQNIQEPVQGKQETESKAE